MASFIFVNHQIRNKSLLFINEEHDNCNLLLIRRRKLRINNSLQENQDIHKKINSDKN